MSTGFCTLAIHEPYRRRAKRLITDAPYVPWIVLTDEPGDFVGLPCRAVRHVPTGPMARDYLAGLRISARADDRAANAAAPSETRAAAAYHDKRFALMAALQEFDTAVYIDADSRITAPLPRHPVPPGLAVLPILRETVAEHLDLVGSWRRPAFEDLAVHLGGDAGVLNVARWCAEAVLAITRDGRERQFFAAWSAAATFMQERKFYSGEGGVIGLAAHSAGWEISLSALDAMAAVILVEGSGPKGE
jgi:hypothetical protein